MSSLFLLAFLHTEKLDDIKLYSIVLVTPSFTGLVLLDIPAKYFNKIDGFRLKGTNNSKPPYN